MENKILYVFILVLIELLAILIVLFVRPDLNNRFVTSFLNHIPIINTTNQNPHWGHGEEVYNKVF